LGTRELSRLLRKVIALQREERLIPPDSKVLVALSGGVDSVVLTDVLLELRGFLRIRDIALAHFNHMLREEARRDEEFCRELARSLGLRIRVGSGDVHGKAKGEGRNIEEVARELRYNFLRKVKEEEGFDLIATAHHLNDLVETSLIWLARGAGLEGITGFEPREGDVVRPLYRATRREILDYARAKGLKWIEDTSNTDPRFFRNRIRMEVIPLLKEVNPNLEETFYRTRKILKEENELIERLTNELLERVSEGGCLKAGELAREPVALQRRVLRRFTGISNFSKVEQVRRLLRRGGEVNLGDGVRAVRRGKLLCLKKGRG